MSLVAASTSITKIKRIIIQKIKDGDMEYKRGFEDMPKTKQIEVLCDDWKELEPDFVLNNLDYGYVEIVVDGEIQ